MLKTHRIPTRDFTDFLRWSILIHGALALLVVILTPVVQAPWQATVPLLAFLVGLAAGITVWYAVEYKRDAESYYDSFEVDDGQ